MSVSESTATKNGTGAKPGLMMALLAVQAEAPRLQKDAENPHFKSRFTSLDHLMAEIVPVLNRHGLVWTTFPCRHEGEPALRYRMTHAATGETLEDVMPLMLAKSDPQGQGSAITYARRYSLTAVLGLTADEDDDGNKAATKTDGKPKADGKLSVQQRERVLKAITDAGQNPALMLAAVGAAIPADLTAVHATQLRRLLDEVKA